ncbi:DNA-binding domain-containing protein [Hahella ganghwensis]|uniref:HvfC/BufC N-terminal domain-containing protein n=1 Tax=Hahella ganghwensis TaxID=286420 RepID=UPI00036533E7|nr:putative DNA-binding domain-containing protein [Hahella ganghwensis]
MNLHELQQSFLDYLYQGSNHLDDYVEEHYLTRLSIYRNNVTAGLTQYLKEVYPVIEKLVGQEFFEAMCERYIRKEQPEQGDVHLYGEGFAGFLCGFDPLAALPYLADVACLEWHHHRAYYITEQPPLDLTTDQEQLLQSRPVLNTGVAIVHSRFPVDAIWQQARDHESEFNVDLESGPVTVLVFRHQQQVQVWNLSEAASALLLSVQSGNTLGEAIESAFSYPGHEQLPEFISQCLQQGIVCQPNNSIDHSINN